MTRIRHIWSHISGAPFRGTYRPNEVVRIVKVKGYRK